MELAKALFALTPSSQKKHEIVNKHGADLILGGHDHLYFVGRGIDAWDNYDLTDKPLGAEKDEGDIMVIKSGTDFRDLIEFVIELVDTPAGSVRRRVISRITARQPLSHCTGPLSMRPMERATTILPANSMARSC